MSSNRRDQETYILAKKAYNVYKISTSNQWEWKASQEEKKAYIQETEV